MPARPTVARRAVALLAVLVLAVVAAFTLTAGPAVADTASLAGTGVAAFDLAEPERVGPTGDISPGQRQETGFDSYDLASGSRVATRAGGGLADDGVRLRPGSTQPSVARTYDTALNPQGYIDDVVDTYGFNLRGSGKPISVRYNPDLASAGRVRAAAPDVIEVGPLGMSSSEELGRTVAHELNHSRSFLRGGPAPESTAYGAEDLFSEWLAGLR